ncbi:MAG TPA: DUF1801 domain-containing protein [Patescibacteria group bacterium]|nr:DUF1801 domain-containing protein [Patescibacteria group bacterium]
MQNYNSKVNAYIKKFPLWQQDICNNIRKLIHQAEPMIKEEIKRSVQPYFTFRGNVAALLNAKDHVTVFIYDPIAPDPKGLINQGKNNLTGRAIQIKQGGVINSRAFIQLIKSVVKNNKAGGWRKLKN